MHIGHPDILGVLCEALGKIGTIADVLAFRMASKDAARLGENHLFQTISFSHTQSPAATQDLEQFRLILGRIRVVRISPSGASWDCETWLLSQAFAGFASFLATIDPNGPLIALHVTRRLNDRPLDGRNLERAFSPFARIVWSLTLSDIEGLSPSFFHYFHRLKHIEIFSVHTDYSRDFTFWHMFGLGIWATLRMLSIDVSGLYTPQDSHGFSTLPVCHMPALNVLKLSFAVNNIKWEPRATATQQGGPLVALARVLQVIHSLSPVSLELVFEVDDSLGWRNWPWEYLDDALVAFAQRHIQGSIQAILMNKAVMSALATAVHDTDWELEDYQNLAAFRMVGPKFAQAGLKHMFEDIVFAGDPCSTSPLCELKPAIKRCTKHFTLRGPLVCVLSFSWLPSLVQQMSTYSAIETLVFVGQAKRGSQEGVHLPAIFELLASRIKTLQIFNVDGVPATFLQTFSNLNAIEFGTVTYSGPFPSELAADPVAGALCPYIRLDSPTRLIIHSWPASRASPTFQDSPVKVLRQILLIYRLSRVTRIQINVNMTGSSVIDNAFLYFATNRGPQAQAQPIQCLP
ncbi:hypothetical protein BKA70DRAFT_1232446 [Coprinopsis sp. MPI-PUGE-AT-0042]|nr:hypothetical protein BKA70DRAFT_1232446 [Coprinopsis sp. MPI-PUGE-AT-0042]